MELFILSCCVLFSHFSHSLHILRWTSPKLCVTSYYLFRYNILYQLKGKESDGYMSGWAGGALVRRPVPHPLPPPSTPLVGVYLDEGEPTFQKHGSESPILRALKSVSLQYVLLFIFCFDSFGQVLAARIEDVMEVYKQKRL